MNHRGRNQCPNCGGAKVKKSKTCQACRVYTKPHGHSANGTQTPTYRIWRSMKDRCLNSGNSYFHRYGGRGIRVCERWLKFENFLADMGERPEGKSLDRFPDNDGNYEPGNVRWATIDQQSNNKGSNVFIEFLGARLTRTQWARKIGIDPTTLLERLRRRWPLERALTQPGRKSERKQAA